MSQRKPCVIKKREPSRSEFGITRSGFITGLLVSIVGFSLAMYAIYLLTDGAFTTMPIDFTAYHAWLETVAWSTGIATIAFLVAAIIIMRSYKTKEWIFIIPLVIGLFIVLWIDFFRPADSVLLFDDFQYFSFTNSIVLAEILLIATFIAGIVWKPLVKCPR